MKRNSGLRNTWSSCVMQMLKRQTRVKGALIFGQKTGGQVEKCMQSYFSHEYCDLSHFVIVAQSFFMVFFPFLT